jgi:hypothetical protein
MLAGADSRGAGLFNELISWSGDLAIGPINFVLPLLVTLTALGVRGVVPDSWALPQVGRSLVLPAPCALSCLACLGV